MQKYGRLSDAGSLHDGSLPEFSPPFATEYDLNDPSRWGKVRLHDTVLSALVTTVVVAPRPSLLAVAAIPFQTSLEWHGWLEEAASEATIFLQNAAGACKACCNPEALSCCAMQIKQWWRVRVLGEPSEPIPPSGYMTLIPLNGDRPPPFQR